jgi:hypothetical protein
MISDAKSDVHRYLQRAREAMIWKLDGLSEYDARRPLVPTGTNLLGLIKHLTGVEFVYFGTTFGRPSPDEAPWSEDDPMTDMFAFPSESREEIIGRYQKAWAHSDATIEALSLDAVGHVPHWPEPHSEVTLHRIALHVLDDTLRHAGQADIIRELIDGSIGLTQQSPNVPDGDFSWTDHWNRVEQAARDAGLPVRLRRTGATRGRGTVACAFDET